MIIFSPFGQPVRFGDKKEEEKKILFNKYRKSMQLSIIITIFVCFSLKIIPI